MDPTKGLKGLAQIRSSIRELSELAASAGAKEITVRITSWEQDRQLDEVIDKVAPALKALSRV